MKGQGALEYLMTYGWAILIIVIIGGSLFALGVFNPSSWSSNKRATGFTSVHLSDWKVNMSGSNAVLTLVVANQYGSTITLWNVSARPSSESADRCWSTNLWQNLGTDSSATIATNSSLNCAPGLSRGKTYSLTVTLSFQAGSLNHTDQGIVTGKIE